MTTLSFRILTGLLFLAIAYVLYGIHFVMMDLPEMAVLYIQWWRTQPLNWFQQFVLNYGILIYAILMVSLVGIGLLWSPARYVFTVIMLLSVITEGLSSVPLVVTGRQIMIDNFIGIMSGMLIFAMFFTPLRHQFVNNPFSARKGQ
jgi:hypothetical protein